jgi:hypothetical protein
MHAALLLLRQCVCKHASRDGAWPYDQDSLREWELFVQKSKAGQVRCINGAIAHVVYC